MKFPHTFHDSELAVLALTHRSVGRPNNERLEFLGDALLGMIVAELLYEAYPRASEGELSRLRAQLVNGQALAELARELELGEHIKLGPGELKSGGCRRDSILADVCEALIAAVYLDAGFDTCRQMLRAIFTTRIEAIPKSSKDAKSQLQEWLQARNLPLPGYELLASHGEDHAKIFEVRCSLSLPETREAMASGPSRRGAEQDAAALLLTQLRARDRQKK